MAFKKGYRQSKSNVRLKVKAGFVSTMKHKIRETPPQPTTQAATKSYLYHHVVIVGSFLLTKTCNLKKMKVILPCLKTG